MLAIYSCLDCILSDLDGGRNSSIVLKGSYKEEKRRNTSWERNSGTWEAEFLLTEDLPF